MIQRAPQVPLRFNELIAKRPFTHPDYIPKDRDVMLYMAKRVCMVLETHFDSLQESQPIIVNESDGRWHRNFIPRPTDLMQAEKVFVVGFFGQKRKGMPSNYFKNLDDRLIEIIPTMNKILSYSTMELPSGDFTNLVLLLEEEIKSNWMEGDLHRKAVDLSPGYYRVIRINNGVFPDGILQNETLRITRVKYYDYQENPPWKAIRELTQ